jgi:predicted transcriptional regulator
VTQPEQLTVEERADIVQLCADGDISESEEHNIRKLLRIHDALIVRAAELEDRTCTPAECRVLKEMEALHIVHTTYPDGQSTTEWDDVLPAIRAELARRADAEERKL